MCLAHVLYTDLSGPPTIPSNTHTRLPIWCVTFWTRKRTKEKLQGSNPKKAQSSKKPSTRKIGSKQSQEGQKKVCRRKTNTQTKTCVPKSARAMYVVLHLHRCSPIVVFHVCVPVLPPSYIFSPSSVHPLLPSSNHEQGLSVPYN